jgi:protein gp37
LGGKVGKNSKIEWTDHTFNPWWGCVEIPAPVCAPGSGCDHCYAKALAKRYDFKVWGKDEPRRFFGDKHWKEPLTWNRDAEKAGQRKRVFCGSMCDVFESRTDLIRPRERLFEMIQQTPWLTWMLLTKRPQAIEALWPLDWEQTGILPNLWLLTTVESQEYAWRIDELLKIPAVLHGISYEPALGPVDFSPYLGCPDRTCCPDEEFQHIDLIVAGGESGPKARPSHPDCFRQARDQCRAAGVAFLFKQWGEWAPDCLCDTKRPHRTIERPPGLPGCMFRCGVKRSGRLLDDREWNEIPEVRIWTGRRLRWHGGLRDVSQRREAASGHYSRG